MIESVRDGATLRATLLPGHVSVTLGLSGIKTPMCKPNAPEPFALEARVFTEARLLGRDVKIVLEGAALVDDC